MTDARLISELTAAAKRRHVSFDADARAFVKSLRGRDELTDEERQRAEELFRVEVDW